MIRILIIALFFVSSVSAQTRISQQLKEWEFSQDSVNWRTITIPHDWSIEGSFSEKHPATNQGGALPTGVGWYKTSFTVAPSKIKDTYINFDGVYCNSEVWVNGNYLGKRPNGYIGFRYEITKWLNPHKSNSVIVRVDNSQQPASRWYTGSGIYRKVWIESINRGGIDQWGVFVTTPQVSASSAKINIKTNVPEPTSSPIVQTTIYDAKGREIARGKRTWGATSTGGDIFEENITIKKPKLWSVDEPYLYKAVTRLFHNEELLDEVTTTFGIRYFNFDAAKGFFLNGKPLKILGVCNHHDLGGLGAAVNVRAIERQLEILKEMGCNAIRTAHNPPAPELLDLCDKMGFIVMDEAFDMWKKRKNKFDYHLDFEQWSKRDLADMIKRDRNHPSIFIWSIGNEIREQFDSTGTIIAKELVDVVKSLDTSRPVTSALTENFPEKNFIYKSGALDILGFNYKLDAYADLPKRFPGGKFIATETSSALATRGYYDMPSDSNRLWPPDSKSAFKGNADYTVSAYDHVYAYWGSTHEAGWNAVKKYPFMAGIFVWSGFDFLGEPVPYPFPARSSYYGVIDLAGFPKDSYYMYQSEWSRKPVLHLFPHWNWQPGQVVDVWAYYNNADEVELFLNGTSLGTKKKEGEALHVSWRVPFAPGTLKAVSRRNGNTVLTREIKTAGKPARITLSADRSIIKAGGEDLSFITVKITDEAGNLVPAANNLIHFQLNGVPATIACVDNGDPVSMEPFKANYRKAFNGQCLLVVRAGNTKGAVVAEARGEGLVPGTIALEIR